MRIYCFCEDLWPCPQGRAGEDYSDESSDDGSYIAPPLLPLWTQVLQRLSAGFSAVGIRPGEPGDTSLPLFEPAEESDVHYILYLDCLRSLRDHYPLSPLTCSMVDGFERKAIHELPSCFGSLAILLADVLRPETLAGPDALRSLDVRPYTTVPPVTSLFSVTLAISFALPTKRERRLRSQCSHLLCAVQASPEDASDQEIDLYHALFLDCAVHVWISLYLWRYYVAVASPMPWSRNSLLESATGPPLIHRAAESVTFGAATLQDLCSDPNGWTRAICHSIGSLLDIPWLGTRHDGFTSCINLFRYTRIRRDPTMPRSLRDDAALWVSAMTFGLLEAVTRIEMVESNFLVPGGQEGETVISGERILQLLGCWRTRLESETEVAALERGRQVVGLLKEALTALLEESHLESSMLSLAGFSEDEVEDIYAAVAFNVRFLCSIATRTVLAWRTIPELVDLRRQLVGDVMFLIDHKVARSCRRRMRKAGWCPYLLHGLFRNQSPIEMVSRLVQLPPYIKSSRDEHEGCKEDACVLYTITDTDSYVPRHVQPSCHCTYVRPPLAEVLELLTQGVVPVVVSDGAALRINSSEQAPYVAISHVWAEGMGSTTDAGLPTCVVQRIAGLARALLPEPEGAFWMDSLCVPSLRNERKRAIMLMAQTYRDAAKVLVIDDCVRTLCSEGKSWDDNLLRIATSQWVRRVWTLQEGILARELYFEFLEGPVKVDARPRVQGDYSASLVPILSFRADGRESGATRETPLSEVVRLLEGRKTTKEEDELIAISSLLPTTVRIDLLLAERDGPNLAERRMRLFLLQLRQIPNEVPFGVNLASRLSLPGFTWAPRTLVTGLHRAWEVKSGTAICTEQGLVADYCLSPLRTPIPVSEESVYVFHTASKTAYVLVSLNLSASPPAKVNALLFVDGEHTMLQGRSAICIAIADEVTGRSTGVEDHGADGGASRDRPRPVIFAGLYAIRRTSLLREQAVMQGELDVVSELGETRPTWVRVM